MFRLTAVVLVWHLKFRRLNPTFHYADFPVRGSFGEVGIMEFGLKPPSIR